MLCSRTQHRCALAGVIIGILAVGFCKPNNCHAQMVINEVMANVKGPENEFGRYNEFVEIYNASSNPLDLSGWMITDGDAVDIITPWSDSLGLLSPNVILDTYVIPGGNYALIIDRDYASAPDSEGYRPYQFAPGTIILTTKNSTIGNGLSTKDPIVLLNASGDTVDTYGTPWDELDSVPFDPGDGISAERVFPGMADTESNWLACVDTAGCTPGSQNSVTPYLGVGLSWEDIAFTPQKPEPGQDVEIRATVHNRSTEPASNVRVLFYVDSDWNSDPDDKELLGTVSLSGIDPFDGKADAGIRWQSPGEGCHRVGVQVRDSVCAFRMLRVGGALGDVIINEIMYDPDRSGEWVEVYNRTNHGLNLRGWRIADGVKSYAICETDIILEPESFALISSDSHALFTTYVVPDCIVLEPGTLPSLNNQGDTVLLSDIAGFESDMVHYLRSWGGKKGVSLERVSAEVKSNERANWSSCVSPEGATPGQTNSIYAGVGPKQARLSLSPNPFSPDGDGFDDRTVISYQLPFSVARLRVMIYDRRGRMVRKVLGDAEVAGKGVLLWDGRDDSGRVQAVGIYVVYAEASDLTTNRKISSKATVVLAKTLN